jgi:nitroreductase
MTKSAIQPEKQTENGRSTDYPIAPVFLRRWSPRAYRPKAMPIEDLLTILEAARWAPSAYNIQPWRFIYALRGDACWETFVSLLDSFNAAWAGDASALVFVVSVTMVPAHGDSLPKPSRTHSFDTGAAWAQMALQAAVSGYQAHAMAGIHRDKVRQRLAVPESFRIEIAVAIGTQVDPGRLPPALRDRESPSGRLALDAVAFAGTFASGEAADGTGDRQ